MIVISIITRRLKEGKTYEDFRKAWFHTTGFGTVAKLYTLINAFDPREIIVIGLVEITAGQDPMKILRIDVKERLDKPLEEIIEPDIARTYGILVSEDDFSSAGEIKYKPSSINGKETDFNDIEKGFLLAKKLIAQASLERDNAKKKIENNCHS
jgi:predicted NBD/HSP70 family sugar kinase